MHIINTTQDGFLRVNRVGKIEEANTMYAKKSGYGMEELIGMEISALDAFQISAVSAERTRRIIENGSELFESVHRRKDGTFWPVEVSTTFESINGGQFIGFIRDLTERKRLEAEIKAENERFNGMLNAIPDFLFEVDSEGRVLNFYTKNVQLFLSPPEFFLGKTFEEFLPENASHACYSAVLEAKELGTSIGKQYSLEYEQ
jgi:PAS domain S-box-containing protein